MSDPFTNEAKPEQQAAPASLDSVLDAVPDTAAPAKPDIDSLLRDFDAATGGGLAEKKPITGAASAAPEREDRIGARPEGSQQDASTESTLEALLHDAGASFLKESVTQPPEVGAELLTALKPLAHAVAAIRAEQAEARNKADFAKVVQLGKDALAEFDHLPEGYAETWLRAESTRNPELRDAFDNRYKDALTLHHAERTFKKAMQSLYAAAKAFPDKDATDDRGALTAWMTRAGPRTAPTGPPPRLGRLTDKELTQHVENTYGYTPNI